MGLAMSVTVTFVFLGFGHAIASCFIRDAGVVSIATVLLVVAAVFQIFDCSQVINSAALRALTDVKVPAAITFVAYWLVALPVGYLLGILGSPRCCWESGSTALRARGRSTAPRRRPLP
jgi:MATE family multidrug resistance protein